MATTYTNIEPTVIGTALSSTEPTDRGTETYQHEPVGGGMGWAGSLKADGTVDEFSRGAGEPETEYTNETD